MREHLSTSLRHLLFGGRLALPTSGFPLLNNAMHPLLPNTSTVVSYLHGFAVTSAIGLIVGICAAVAIKIFAANRGMSHRAQRALAQGALFLGVVFPQIVYWTSVRP
jgi:hypothetical protein